MAILTDFMYICRMNPFVSIIIPFYGEADPALLQRALDSIRGQGMAEEEYEIIITDDASQTTGGARNNGMRQARGEYLLFVDADDILLPHALPPCLTLLRQYSPDILRFGFRRLKRVAASASASTGTPASPASAGTDRAASPASASTDTPASPVPVSADCVAPPSPSPQPDVQPPTYTRYPSGAHYMLSTNFLGVVWAHLFRRDMLQAAGLTFSETSFFEDEEFVAKAYYHAQSMLVTPSRVYGYSCPPASRSLPPTALARCKKMDAFCFMILRLDNFIFSKPHYSFQERALGRRVYFLVIDYIRQMLRNRCGICEIHRRLSLLNQIRLLPLPAEDYGWKYRFAAFFINLYDRHFLSQYDSDYQYPYENPFGWRI